MNRFVVQSRCRVGLPGLVALCILLAPLRNVEATNSNRRSHHQESDVEERFTGKIKVYPVLQDSQLGMDVYGRVHSIWYSDGIGQPVSETFYLEPQRGQFDQLGTITFGRSGSKKICTIVPGVLSETAPWVQLHQDGLITLGPHVSDVDRGEFNKVQQVEGQFRIKRLANFINHFWMRREPPTMEPLERAGRRLATRRVAGFLREEVVKMDPALTNVRANPINLQLRHCGSDSSMDAYFYVEGSQIINKNAMWISRRPMRGRFGAPSRVTNPKQLPQIWTKHIEAHRLPHQRGVTIPK